MSLLRPLLLTALIAAVAAPPAVAADPLRPRQWNLDLVNADAALASTAGLGAVVAVVDSGVQFDHPDLVGRLLPGRDFVEGDDVPNDENGHGTHVTGIIVANRENGVGIAGVAPAAQVLPLRALDAEGNGELEDVVSAIELAIARRVDVLNLSLGPSAPLGISPALGQALDAALDAGIVVVAAAGNDGLPLCEHPSGRGRLLCVGAVDRRGFHSFFSNFGQGVGLVGPGGSSLPLAGEDVLSTGHDGEYAELAGTSQAAPHVAGVAALLASRDVRGPAAVQRIIATTRDLGPPGPDLLYGAGLVDAAAAVAGLPAPSPDATPPPASPRPGAGRLVFTPVHRSRTALRAGVRVRCTAAGAGRCALRIVHGGRTLFSGARAVSAGRPVTIRLRATPYGRAVLRRRTGLSARLVAQMPGATLMRAISFRR